MKPIVPTLALAAGLLCLGASSHAASREASLLAVSPGSTASEELSPACPTFHWATSLEAEGYELVVHRIGGIDLIRADAVGQSGAPALRQILPAGASGWTAPLDRCLEPGGRYSWTIRLVDDRGEGAGAWAEPLHFVVRERSRLERVLSRVVRRLVDEGELTEEDAEQLADWGLSGNSAVPAAGGRDSTPTRKPTPIPPIRTGFDRTPPPRHLGPARMGAENQASVDAGLVINATGHERGVSAVGDTFGVLGFVPTTTGSAAGVYGLTSSTTGDGVLGVASAGSGPAFGVRGASASTAGTGVLGHATASNGLTAGVTGISDSVSGRGVVGVATNATSFNQPIGVYGESRASNGQGVQGINTDNGVGVFGVGQGASGWGVFGSGQIGVHGQSDSNSGTAVQGIAVALFGAARGVSGQTFAVDGIGVEGIAFSTTGNSRGVLGRSDSASGFDFYAGGAGTNYGPFTGGHEVLLADGTGELEPGMVVSVTGTTRVREENGDVNLSSTLPTVTLANCPHDPAVFGVLVAEADLPSDHWYQPRDGERFATVNALGEGRVWVTDANGPVVAGDFLTTSTVAGHAQRQDDGILRHYTLGKVIETVDWESVTETVEHGGEMHKRALIAVVYTSG